MNLSIKIVLLFSLITMVYCDFTADWMELQNSVSELLSLNEKQLIRKINGDIKFVDNAIDKRLSQTQELKIYSDLTLKFIKFYKEFHKQFEKVFNKQKEVKKRKALLIRLASITTTMRYDEEWRAVNFKISSEPTNSSDQSFEEMQQQFRQLMLKLNTVLHTNAEKNYFQHQMFWYHFYSRLSGFYMKAYMEADIEANKLNKNESQINLWVLIQDLQRFLYLISLGSKPTKQLQKLH